MEITKRQLLQIIKEEAAALEGPGQKNLNEGLKDILARINKAVPELGLMMGGSVSEEDALRALEMLGADTGELVQDTGNKPLPGKMALKKQKSFTDPTGQSQQWQEADETDGDDLKESLRDLVKRFQLKESLRKVIKKHSRKK